MTKTKHEQETRRYMTRDQAKRLARNSISMSAMGFEVNLIPVFPPPASGDDYIVTWRRGPILVVGYSPAYFKGAVEHREILIEVPLHNSSPTSALMTIWSTARKELANKIEPSEEEEALLHHLRSLKSGFFAYQYGGNTKP